jgi:acetylserotonin N-methyltransferase
MTPPDSAPIIDLIEAFRRSKTMFTAVRMGVFDRLHERPASASVLAAEMDANAGALERLLDTCAALDLLRKDAGVYANSPLADRYLRAASPYSLDGYIRYSDEALYPMWGHLGDAVKEGSNRWKQVFGIEGAIFSGFFRTEEAMRTFLRGMHGLGMTISPQIVELFDLGRFRRMADLGGGTGHLAIAACERYPSLHGVVFDLPKVTAVAREMIEQSSARGRMEAAPGDFFADELPQADLYSLGRILHDWCDEKCGDLLRRIYGSLPSGGALLVMEKLLAPDGVGPVSANLQSLNMLVVTEGRERTLHEYTQLLRAAGFAEVEGRTTGGWLDGVMGVKR